MASVQDRDFDIRRRGDAIAEVKALKGREYGKGVTRCCHEEFIKPMYIAVDHYHIDREVVATAWNLCDRMISKQTAAGLNQNRLGVILVTCLVLAIKTKCRAYCEGEIADNLLRALCTLVGKNNTCTPQQVSDMEKEMLKTLDWKVNAPTMQDFVKLYVDLHPVGKLGARSDTFVAQYLNEITRYQVEQAIYKQELMMNYKPSVIAFAAMIRVEEGLEEAVLPLDMREAETLSLHGELGLEPAEVEECLFALENYTEKITPYEEFEAEIRNNAAAANNVQEDNHRTDSVASDDRQAESIRGGNDDSKSRSRGRSRSRSLDDQEGSGDEDKRRGRSREGRRKNKRKRSKSSRRRSASYSSASSSSSSSRSRSRRSRKRKKHTNKRSKKSKKRRHRSKKSDVSSTSSSSYDRDRKRRKKQKKKYKTEDDKSTDRTKSDAISKQSEQINKDAPPQADAPNKKAPPVASKGSINTASKPPPSASAQSRAPMTQQQYLALQSQVREVVDPQTGRTRLVRGTGEIIERLVSRDEHSRLNKSATLGDGSGYAQDIMQAAVKRGRK